MISGNILKCLRIKTIGATGKVIMGNIDMVTTTEGTRLVSTYFPYIMGIYFFNCSW
jgi:hypothetical protein